MKKIQAKNAGNSRQSDNEGQETTICRAAPYPRNEQGHPRAGEQRMPAIALTLYFSVYISGCAGSQNINIRLMIPQNHPSNFFLVIITGYVPYLFSCRNPFSYPLYPL
jgi:hypothetical protein